MEFQLGGKGYVLSKDEVEDYLKHIVPEDVRKHYVSVNGRRYPVKQALAAAIGRPVTDFITTDAIRIFSNLGFEVGNINEPKPQLKNTSEILLEKYLASNGLGYFQFHKQIPGSPRPPDYSLSFKGQEILFEVKEFRAAGEKVENDSMVRAVDPYHFISEKIGAGRKKFKNLENYCCCLVLWNEGKPSVFLQFPELTFGAMLGKIEIKDPSDQTEQPSTTYSGEDGKMVHKEGSQVIIENTRISAILVLESLEIGQRRFRVDLRRSEREGNKLSVAEAWEMYEKAQGTERDYALQELRVVVCENPTARKPLPKEMFRGPYDERYGSENGYITRLYAGAKILEVEKLEAEFPDHLEEYLRDGTGESVG
jgi:hypothetical protein